MRARYETRGGEGRPHAVAPSPRPDPFAVLCDARWERYALSISDRGELTKGCGLRSGLQPLCATVAQREGTDVVLLVAPARRYIAM